MKVLRLSFLSIYFCNIHLFTKVTYFTIDSTSTVASSPVGWINFCRNYCILKCQYQFVQHRRCSDVRRVGCTNIREIGPRPLLIIINISCGAFPAAGYLCQPLTARSTSFDTHQCLPLGRSIAFSYPRYPFVFSLPSVRIRPSSMFGFVLPSVFRADRGILLRLVCAAITDARGCRLSAVSSAFSA